MVRGKPLSFDRDEVLARAMDLFWQNGYEKTGMTDLLEHMGIQRQSFYNTFGSKEKIFLEAVALYTRSTISEIVALLEKPGNPLDNVRQVFDMWREMGKSNDGCGCMMGNSIAEFGLNHETVGQMLKDNVSRLVDAFHGAFSRAVSQGHLPADKDPMVLARSIVVISQGMALLSKLSYSDEMMEDVFKGVEALIRA